MTGGTGGTGPTHPGPSGPTQPTPPGRLQPTPMPFHQREEHYLAQNAGRPLTPRQKKRLLKKSHQAMALLAAGVAR